MQAECYDMAVLCVCLSVYYFLLYRFHKKIVDIIICE